MKQQTKHAIKRLWGWGGLITIVTGLVLSFQQTNASVQSPTTLFKVGADLMLGTVFGWYALVILIWILWTHSRNTKNVIKRFWLSSGFVGIVVGLVLSIQQEHNTDATPVGVLLILGTLFVWYGFPLLFLMLRAYGRHLDQAFRNLREAESRSYLTPPEIELALYKEWGRPTVEEVAAVQQMLHQQRNQALLDLGISLGAIYLAGHAAEHLKGP